MESFGPDDLFFDDVVASCRGVPRFVRRDWLAGEVARRLADPACRFVLLTGEPGAGKSAFIAQLAQEHPDWPRFFIRRDQVSPVAESDARSFLLRIGFQLAAAYPELFDLEEVRIEVAQRIGAADPGSDVVGAEVDRLYASPFHRAVLRVWQEIDQAGGAVAGIRVGEWVTDPRLLALADLEQMALLDPARVLRRLRPDAQLVVLVDALDELRFRDQDGSLLEWLANLAPLPENVRIVLTSRPSLGQLAVFRERQRDRVAALAIDAGDTRVQADIWSYAEAMTEPAPVAAAIAGSGRDEAEFLADLVAKADGNIGYLAAIGRAFDQAAAGERRGALEELLSLSALPDGIQGLYAFFMRLIQTGPGRKDLKVTDPDTHRAGLVNAWEELFHPVLRVLAVCLAPLTLDQLHVLTGTLADRAQLAGAVEWLDQFLDQAGNGYRLYHGSLAEFLVARATGESAETAGFFVDATAEHRRLAGVLEGADGPEAVWRDTSDPREQGRRDYARWHYVDHLYLGGDTARLTAAIDDGRYGRGKLRFDPSTALYAGDLQLAIRAITRDGLTQAERLDQLPRLWRYNMLRSSLTSNADNYPGAAFAALCLVGRADEAEHLAELLSSAERQGLVYAAMGEVLASLPGGGDRARDLLLRSCAVAPTLRDETERAFVVDRILEACRAAAAAGFRDPVLAGEVYALACWYLDNGGDSEALAIAIWYFHLSGAEPTDPWQEIGAVDDMIAASRDRAQEEGDPVPMRVSILMAVSRIEHLLERADDARATLLTASAVARSGDPEERVDGLAAVARQLAGLGDRGQALAFAGEARELNAALRDQEEEPGGAIALGRMPGSELSIGEVLAEAGDWEAALSVSAEMATGWASPALAAVRELCRRSDWDRAIATAAEMSARERQRLASGRDIVEVHNRGERHTKPENAYLAIVEGLAASGQHERAAGLARGLEAAPRAEGLALVASACARQGLADRAGSLLAEMHGLLQQDAARARRDRIWPPLVDLFAAADAFAEGRQAARLASSAEVAGECQERIATALAGRGRFNEALDVVAGMDGWRVDAALAVQQHVPPDGADFPEVSGRVLDLIAADLAEGRSYETPDETKLVAQPLIAMASLRSRRGEHQLAAALLSDAFDALNQVRRFVYQPTPWHLMPAALLRAGQLQAALQLMNQITEPIDRTCGLAEFAKAADADERPDVAYNMLADALATVANTDWMMLSLVLNRARDVAARVGLPDLLGLLLADFPSADPWARGEIAAALAEQGAVGQALDILAALPDELSQPYAEVISALLRQGDLGAAEGLLPKVTDDDDRIRLCTELAAALAGADRAGDAVDELISGGERWEAAPRWWLDGELRDIAAALRETADAGTALLQVEKRWKRAATWEQLAGSFGWAHAVVTQRPGIAAEIAAGFDWVDAAIADDPPG